MNDKRDNKAKYTQQEDNITANSEAFINLLTSRGILGDSKIDNEKIRAAKREKRKNTYHNTLMLLKNYRTIAWMIECFPDTIAAELEEPFECLDDLIDRVEAEVSFSNKKLENRIEGVQKSRMLIDRVNEALTVLKKKPDNGKKLYDLIYNTYITPEKLSLTEILYRLDVSPRHYYRLREQAINIIAVRLWALPGTDADFWLDMLTLMESLS